MSHPVVVNRASPEYLAEYGAGHPMIDERGNPTTLDDGPGCREIVLWERPKVIRLEDAAHHYLVEHIIPRGASVQRNAQAMAEWMRALDPQMDISTMKREHGRALVAHVLGRGLKSGSARRILSVGRAALNHEKREERIKVVPMFAEPEPGSPRVRWLTREEHNRLMALPKRWPRIQRFWHVAFASGARSEAVEELTWDRVDFNAGTMDFRVPGVAYRNKRRAVVPMSERFAKRLYGWKQAADSQYVIGLGVRGKPSCTWRECKANLRAIGIDEEGVCRHVARHTVASWLLQGDPENGVAPMAVFDVAQFLGDTVRMIEKTYAHILPRHLMRCAVVLPS